MTGESLRAFAYTWDPLKVYLQGITTLPHPHGQFGRAQDIVIGQTSTSTPAPQPPCRPTNTTTTRTTPIKPAMKSPSFRLARLSPALQAPRPLSRQFPINTFRSIPPTRRPFTQPPPRRASRKQPGDDPNFTSILDNPPELVRTGRRHGPGLIILALIPITALVLGTWQVQRLGWKTELIARFEDRLVQPPLPLPPRVDPEAIHDFDFRRVVARGAVPA